LRETLQYTLDRRKAWSTLVIFCFNKLTRDVAGSLGPRRARDLPLGAPRITVKQVAEKPLMGGVAAILYRQNGLGIKPTVATSR
jgi:hypothetical protein